MKVGVRNFDGSETKKQVDLKKAVFGIEPHNPTIHAAVKVELAHRRQGTASTKTRAEVRGSGVKLFRQKGTGRARVGDAASPIRTGGGVAFGPKPRDYDLKINRKAKKLARRSMLSILAQEKRIVVVEKYDLEEPRTRGMRAALEALGLQGSRLVVLAGQPDRNLYLSSRNLPGVQVKQAADVSTHDLWASDFLLIDLEGVKQLNSVLGN
ncbi:MAG: 50S ribosomal protein L4 [Candidatus Neomarinimicrobiota bacterium]